MEYYGTILKGDEVVERFYDDYSVSVDGEVVEENIEDLDEANQIAFNLCGKLQKETCVLECTHFENNGDIDEGWIVSYEYDEDEKKIDCIKRDAL